MRVRGYVPFPTEADRPYSPSVSEPVDEQLGRLQRTFTAGLIWHGRDDLPGAHGRREPFVRGLNETDYSFAIREFQGRRCVVLEFGHDSAPGVRFVHRFRPPHPDDEDFSDVHFMENVETGKLTRSRTRASQDASVVWTDFSWGFQDEPDIDV
jgi:hypothetical protein